MSMRVPERVIVHVSGGSDVLLFTKTDKSNNPCRLLNAVIDIQSSDYDCAVTHCIVRNEDAEVLSAADKLTRAHRLGCKLVQALSSEAEPLDILLEK